MFQREVRSSTRLIIGEEGAYWKLLVPQTARDARCSKDSSGPAPEPDSTPMSLKTGIRAHVAEVRSWFCTFLRMEKTLWHVPAARPSDSQAGAKERAGEQGTNSDPKIGKSVS